MLEKQMVFAPKKDEPVWIVDPISIWSEVIMGPEWFGRFATNKPGGEQRYGISPVKSLSQDWTSDHLYPRL
jgi:hypothetical protein